MRRRSWLSICSILCCFLLCAAAFAEASSGKQTDTPLRYPTARPTRTPKPTGTPRPTKPPAQTRTPRPTSGPTPLPTPAPTKKPTATPRPTRSPRPTASPTPLPLDPSATPLPNLSAALYPDAPADQKVVYLTFDDGPCPRTPELLAMLEQEDVKATFFFIGASIDAFPEHARAVYEAGHAIGSHSYHHFRRLLSDEETFSSEKAMFDLSLAKALGAPLDVRLFRFPYGSTWTPLASRQAALDNGYLWIDWNASNNDAEATISRNTDRMLQTAISTSRHKTKVVILMHENKYRTISMLPDLLSYYRESGYVFDILTPEMTQLLPGIHMGLPSTGAMQ